MNQQEHYLRLADAATLQAKYRKRYVVAAPAEEHVRELRPVVVDPDFWQTYIGSILLLLYIVVIGFVLSR